MEYFAYILIILVIAGLCLFLMPKKGSGRSFAKKTIRVDTTTGANHAVLANNREMGNVPRPWGWPGHSADKNPAVQGTREVHYTLESLRRLVDRLLREKQTVENKDYELKKDAALKALLEDRYGRGLTTPETTRQKAKPPLDRRPGTVVGMKKLQEVKTPRGW
jgi:hypothetical protein